MILSKAHILVEELGVAVLSWVPGYLPGKISESGV